MKKLIFICLATILFSCGEGKRSGEHHGDDHLNNTESAEPDTAAVSGGIESDTTSTWDRHRDNFKDTIR